MYTNIWGWRGTYLWGLAVIVAASLGLGASSQVWAGVVPAASAGVAPLEFGGATFTFDGATGGPMHDEDEGSDDNHGPWWEEGTGSGEGDDHSDGDLGDGMHDGDDRHGGEDLDNHQDDEGVPDEGVPHDDPADDTHAGDGPHNGDEPHGHEEGEGHEDDGHDGEGDDEGHQHGPGMAHEMIELFYLNVLDREPEGDAVDHWHGGYYERAHLDGIGADMIWGQMGHEFFFSDEYAARERDDGEFVTDCYQALLQRAPDRHEIAAWVDDLGHNSRFPWHRARVVTAFAECEEYLDLIADLFPDDQGDPVQNFVGMMYISVLDRMVDKEGLEYWSNHMNASADKRQTAEDLAHALFTSHEGVRMALTDAERVMRLYRAFLGRYPADHETDYWAGQLASGSQDLESLIDSFGDSAEFGRRMSEHFPGS